MSPEVIAVIVTFLTGGGLITLITQAVRGWRSVRTGALSSTRGVVKDLIEARDEAEDRRDECEARAMYWQSVAGGYHYQLTSRGAKPDPLNPSPPTLTPAAKRARRRARNADRPSLEESGDVLS
jgi:hypothetical protein